jgi:hypothetical protein
MARTQALLAGFKRFQQLYFEDDSRLYAKMKEG